MNKQFIKKMKKRLVEERSVIINSLMEKDNNIDADGDETDEIQANLFIFLNEKLTSKQKGYINAINKALAKIESGDYGTCEDCDENIFEKRLEFNPCFTTCVKCSEIREKEIKGKIH